MQPHLPINLATITPTPPIRNAGDVITKYKYLIADKFTLKNALNDLAVLRALDTYERTSTLEHENAKAKLNEYITICHELMNTNHNGME